MLIKKITNARASQLIGKIDTVLLPVGTIEAHGPHLSVAADVIVPELIASEVEKLAGDRVFVAPAIPYGHTWHLKDFAGSHDVPLSVLSDYVYHVLKGFLEWKVKYAVILNGHGGNDGALRLAAERSADLGIKTVVLGWWEGQFLERLRSVIPEPEGHAGEGETSLVWNVWDEFIDVPIIPKEDHVFSYSKGKSAAGFVDTFDPAMTSVVFPRAYSGRPGRASKETGRRLNQECARLVVETIDALRAGSLLGE
jgi:creatinine amidohydrolase